jgi:hypothetical protein
MSRQEAGRPTASPPWLYESQIEGEGRPALYPYAQLRNIRAPEDVRPAVKDECDPIETEFGIHAVEPFHRLIWLLNTVPAFFTTHVNVAPRAISSPRSIGPARRSQHRSSCFPEISQPMITAAPRRHLPVG